MRNSDCKFRKKTPGIIRKGLLDLPELQSSDSREKYNYSKEDDGN